MPPALGKKVLSDFQSGLRSDVNAASTFLVKVDRSSESLFFTIITLFSTIYSTLC